MLTLTFDDANKGQWRDLVLCILELDIYFPLKKKTIIANNREIVTLEANTRFSGLVIEVTVLVVSP